MTGRAGRTTRGKEALDRGRTPAAQETIRDSANAVARFAAGIGRRYQVPLFLVARRLELVITKLEEGHPAREHVEEARGAIQQLVELSRMILATGRDSPLSPTRVDLGEIAGRLANEIRPILPPTIELVTDRPPEPCTAFVDPAQLDEALSHLVMNAIDAMPRGGTLRLGAEEVRPDRVSLVVADTGDGMPKAVRHRVAEPFFTTKPGRNVGLGLSAVRGFAEQSGGSLELRSRRGSGTTVRLVFPRTPPR